jgi:hypothetical protein
MRTALAAAILIGVSPGAALAGSECRDWERLDAAGKAAEIDGRIEGHLSSNVGKRYTSENTVAMRLCLRRFAPEISAQFDGACAAGRSTSSNELDQIFDRYFLSCVQ